MDPSTRTHLDQIRSDDGDVQGAAYQALLKATEVPVDWSYEAWDGLVAALSHKNNKTRSIASQLLCNLAKSDPDDRMGKDFGALLHLTKDEKFVTARHCLQSLWKIGKVGKAQQDRVVDGLAGRFAECIAEKNCTLIRYDILEGLRKLYDAVGDESIRAKADELMATEADPKYRKKYSTLWKVK